MPDGARRTGVEPEVIIHLVQLYIPVIAVLYLTGAFFLRFYKIDRASHEATLASIRAKEAAQLTENTTS